MNQNKLFNSFLIYGLFLISSFFIMRAFGLTMVDDGWRHLAMAFHQEQMKSWGNLFLHSLYEEYDPWFLWHILLNKLSLYVGQNNVPLTLNTFIYFALSSWVYLILNKHSKLSLWFKIIFAIGIPLLTPRYYNVRPDVLSGLFLLSIVLIQNNKILLALISIVYMPFYYVFWFYFGYVGFIKLALKEYKQLFILISLTLIGFIFHLSYDQEGYMHIMHNVLNNDALTAGYSVGESDTFLVPDLFKEVLGSGGLLLFMMGFSFLCLLVFKPKNTLLKYLILFIPLILSQYRFYHLLQPLIFVYVIIVSHKISQEIQESSFSSVIQKGINIIKQKSYFTNLSQKSRTTLLAVLIIFFFTSQFIHNIKGYETQHRLTKAAEIFKNESFKGKKIFLSDMGSMMYRAIYFNPTGQYMPNCSLGWVDYDAHLKKIYFKILDNDVTLSKNELFEFIKFNNFDYFILVTENSTNMEFSHKEINNYGYYFEKIIKGNLVFKRK